MKFSKILLMLGCLCGAVCGCSSRPPTNVDAPAGVNITKQGSGGATSGADGSTTFNPQNPNGPSR